MSQHHGYLVSGGTRRDQILFAVSIEIRYGNTEGGSDSLSYGRLEGSVTIADQNTERAGGRWATHKVTDSEVPLSVTIEVSRRLRFRIEVHEIIDGAGKRAVPVVEKHTYVSVQDVTYCEVGFSICVEVRCHSGVRIVAHGVVNGSCKRLSTRC